MTVTSDIVQGIAARIVAEFAPERVVLFGSHAWGQSGPVSDVDLLVVANTEDSLRMEGQIARRCRPRFTAMDVLVKTPAEVEARLQLGDPFMREIVERGRVLYYRAAGSRVD